MIGLLDGLLAGGPELRGPRIFLRPPRGGDWADWARARDESFRHLRPWEPDWTADALTRAAYRRRLAHLRDEKSRGASQAFHIFAHDRTLLGGIGIGSIRRGAEQSGEVGYWLRVSAVRRGVMAEALALVLAHGFGAMRLHRIEATCRPENLASRKLLEKLGFREEGLMRESMWIDGGWADHLRYAKLAGD